MHSREESGESSALRQSCGSSIVLNDNSISSSSSSSSRTRSRSNNNDNNNVIISRNITRSRRTNLVSLMAYTLSLLLLSSMYCWDRADAGSIMGHPFSKRSFMDIQCKGVYDKSLFARLDRICEDCYNLFREPQLHTLCRKNCFTSDYFKGCLDVLLLQDEMEWIQTSIKQLHGADPGVEYFWMERRKTNDPKRNKIPYYYNQLYKRQNCFGSEYFTSCIQALLLEDEKEKFQEIAEYLGRKK